jgi:Ca2+:H+ antiporter
MPSIFAVATSLAAVVVDADGVVLAQPFLDVCRLVLPVVERLGAAFLLVRSDVQGNIDRLAARMAADPARFAALFDIAREEQARGAAGASDSCARGLLWLMRAMRFVLALLAALCERPEEPLPALASEAYYATLNPYHGYLASAAFALALRFVPDRGTFYESAGLADGGGTGEVAAFVAAFGPTVAAVHAFLAEAGLDDPATV